jgi:hypothetical protein
MRNTPGPSPSHRDPAPRYGERNPTAAEIRGTGRETDEDILYEARERFRRVIDWEGSFRASYLDDVRFVNGDADNHWQWPNAMYSERGDRPTLTINKTRQHCLQIINDAKQNKPQVRISPVSDEATKASADIFEGICRHIEYISNATTAYDTATEHQVHGGIGWWRVMREYESDGAFEQGLRIQRIRDPMSVYMDPDIQQADGSDAHFAFVVDDVPRDQFELKYPEYADRIPQGGFAGDNISGGWLDDDHVRVAEYFRRVLIDDVLHQLPDGSTIRESDIGKGATVDDLRGLSSQSRAVQREEIEWFKIVGGQIVDERIEPGRYIPLVRVVGEETVIEGRLERKGHVRALKDPQRMYNYWSALSLHTPLPVPGGWATMAEVEPGDQLLDEQGRPTTIVGKSPVFLHHRCRRVEFDDGSHIIADDTHLWQVEERGKRQSRSWQWANKVIPTRELTPGKHFILTPQPLDLPEAALPLDPYLLGMWLGNGTATGGAITNGTQDLDETRQYLGELGYRLSPVRMHPEGSAGTFTVYDIVGRLRQLGLLGNKHIPLLYLRASAQQRWALLQGLMDTDGSANNRLHTCSLSTSIPALSEGFAELLSSLGLKSVRLHRAARRRQMPGSTVVTEQLPHDQFTFSAGLDVQVFRLHRKRAVQQRNRITHWRRTKRFRIKSVREVPSEPVQCVYVDAPSHLFLCGPSMIPTHNSSAVESVALQSKTPYVAAAESIEAFQSYWDSANSVNHSVLPYNARDDQGQALPPPTRQDPPQMPQAYLAGMAQASQELMMASGQYQPTLGQPSPSEETSGRAIGLRQRQGDNATYHYIDGLATAIRFTGRILLDLIPLVYDTPRVLQILGVDGTVDKVAINPQQQVPLQTVPNPQAPMQALPQGGQSLPPQQAMAASVMRIFNPAVGRYEVQADVGPAYATKRQQAFDAFLQIVQTSPQMLNVAGDILMKSADFPFAEDLAERLQRMVPPNILGQGPSPQEQQLTQQLQQSQAHVALLAEKLAVADMKLKVGSEQTDIKAYEAVTGRMGKLLSMASTDGAYVDGTEVRALIMNMVRDAMQMSGMITVEQAAAQDMAQQQAILQGLAPSSGQPQQPGGISPEQLAALSPMPPPNLPANGGMPG